MKQRPRARIRLGVLLAAGTMAGAVLLAAAQAPAPRSDNQPGPRLSIQAVAYDRGGRAVTDLRPDELEVWIGVYRVPIDRVTVVTSGAERAERTVVLLFDDLTQDPSMSPRVRELGRQFVSRLAPGDRMGVATLDRDEIEFSDDPVRLRKRIDEHFGGHGMQPFDLIGERLFERITAISKALAEASGRKAIVAIGGAWLFDRPIHPASLAADLRREWTAAMRALAFADLQVYVVDPGGVGPASAGTGDSGFARETGGYAFVNTNDFDGAVDRIVREIDNHYVVEVADPPIYRTSDLRELDLRVKRKGVVVRARRWIPGTATR